MKLVAVLPAVKAPASKEVRNVPLPPPPPLVQRQVGRVLALGDVSDPPASGVLGATESTVTVSLLRSDQLPAASCSWT